jgi:predicted dehydrogenase
MDMSRNVINVGIVGLGQAGLRHLEAFTNLNNVEIQGVADPDKKILNDLEIKYDFTTFTSYKDLFDLKLDILVISTPHRYLYQIGVDAANLGINVLIEKPIALNLSDATNLVKHCDDKNVKMGVSFVHRYRKEVQKTKEWILEKKLGKLLLTNTTMVFPQRQPLPKWLNSPKDSGGGVIMYSAIHSLDMLCWLINDVCISVTAKCGTFNQKDKVENFASCMFQFSKGTCSTLTVSTNVAVTKGHTWKTNFIFQNGMITLFIKKYSKYISNDNEMSYEAPVNVDVNYNFTDQARDYVNCIINNKEPFINGNDAITSMKIVDAIYESSKCSSTIDINY